MLVTARDVSDQVALRQQVTHLTFHDGLTGLPNRAYVEERAGTLPRDGRRAARRPASSSSTWTASPRSTTRSATARATCVLAQAARRLRAVVPPQDTVARWGGDEFAVLVENAARAARRSSISPSGWPARSPASRSGWPASGCRADRERRASRSPTRIRPALVLRNADVAMSRAKEPAAAGSRSTPRTCTPTWSAGWRSPATCSGRSARRARAGVPADRGAGHLAGHRRGGAGPLAARSRRRSRRVSSSAPRRNPG